MKNSNYRKLFAMLAVPFLLMYVVMFLNVERADHIYLSLTRFYMALLIVSPMALTMLLFMPKMYKDTRTNAFICNQHSGIYLGADIASIPDSDRRPTIYESDDTSPLVRYCDQQFCNIKDPQVRKFAGDIIISQREKKSLR